MVKRVFFIGDELITGQGDARALGWIGRVLARTESEPPVLPITLAFPSDTTASLSERWTGEVLPRMGRDDEHYMVIALGSHDIDAGVTTARSRLHLANILDATSRYSLTSLVVGPPPRPDLPERAQVELTRAFREVCERRNVPFVDCYTPLKSHEQWLTDMSTSHMYTPRQAGYALIAWLVTHRGWHRWLGVKEA
ncbi:GDSL-type esterase/lipase family protein [Arcanobacterium canis]